MEEKKKCLHKACKCESVDGSDYCSLYCETANAQHEEGDGCGCGHPACSPSETQKP
jgi:hypothetical protein